MTVPFIGPSYSLATRKADWQRVVNMFPVMNEVVGGKTAAYLQQVPGLDVFSEPYVPPPPPPPPCDPYWNNVILLLHGRGEDGSSAITDSSKYLDHKTAPAGLTISNDAAKFGTTSLKVTYQNIGDFFWEDPRFIRLPGVPYTIEFWFKHVSSQNTTSSPLIYRHMNDAVVQTQVSQYSTGSTVQLFTGAGPEDPVGYTADADGWVFGAIAYDGVSSATFYIQGVAAAVYGGGGSVATTSKFYVLGFGGVGTESVEFYLQELRVTNGVNRYPANFTPPTEPFPDVECV